MGQVTGVVTRIQSGQAVVECAATAAAACASCAHGRGCGWQQSGLSRQLLLDLPVGECPLRPGESVAITVDDRQLLAAALRLYLPPLAGVLAGPALLRATGWEQGAAPLLAAGAGLALGAIVAWRWTRRPVSLRWHRLAPTPGTGVRS
jgi:positive regulator of sigma E activity